MSGNKTDKETKRIIRIDFAKEIAGYLLEEMDEIFKQAKQSGDKQSAYNQILGAFELFKKIDDKIY